MCIYLQIQGTRPSGLVFFYKDYITLFDLYSRISQVTVQLPVFFVKRDGACDLEVSAFFGIVVRVGEAICHELESLEAAACVIHDIAGVVTLVLLLDEDGGELAAHGKCLAVVVIRIHGDIGKFRKDHGRRHAGDIQMVSR